MAHSRVRIAARLRPPIAGEGSDDAIRIVPAEDGTSCICVENPRDTSQIFRFPFSSCYDHLSTQEQIFEQDVQPLIDIVYSGVTVTIFAYGVTSSGKTHTMQGSASNPGIIPRAVEALFERKVSMRESSVALEVSYMEIYKDECYDLLVTRENAPKLPVRENDSGQVFVANLTALPLRDVSEFDAIYTRATKHRSVGATNLNRASSRSHAILTVTVSIVDPIENRTLTGKLNLVDLAGSENNKLTGNDPSRMAESSAINKSLSVLGQVVHALNQGASRIPYRNSKLTRILQDALGGSSVGLLICNLAPGVKFRQDTLNTLNFAVRTKNVENKPVVNEKDNAPPQKFHFGAAQQPAAKRKFTGVPIPGQNKSSRPSLSRPMIPLTRMPRASVAGGSRSSMGGMSRPQSSARQDFNTSGNRSKEVVGISDTDIDERIAKAVEAEVARRLAEREKVLKEEEAKLREERRLSEESRASTSQTLPSGVLTPILRRHQDLDEELKQRLSELEQKLERGNKELQMTDVLSPLSRKKTGRAYVALARAHSEKNNLQLALDLYRKAENYVPDNVKLKERIIEIEWAVKNNKEFKPSPKRSRKSRPKKAKAIRLNLEARGDEIEDKRHHEEDKENDVVEGRQHKRRMKRDDRTKEPGTLPKKRRVSGDSEDCDDGPLATPVKAK